MVDGPIQGLEFVHIYIAGVGGLSPSTASNEMPAIKIEGSIPFVKVILIGESSVGKTSIIQRFTTK